jgi:hypothetical protein|tara:strand:+ start:498 stop:665 length:168 start_codon:yes stop_codon:yes gene_type:complete
LDLIEVLPRESFRDSIIAMMKKSTSSRVGATSFHRLVVASSTNARRARGQMSRDV